MLLTPTQIQFLDWLDNHEFAKNIYWTGGTALAFKYKHRLSTDLDFFSMDLLADYQLLPFIAEIKSHFGILSVSQQRVYNRAIFLFDEHLDHLKMEFTYFPFLRQKIGSKWKNQLEIDTPWDIGINKIHAVTERQEIKDVYDLYEICTREKVTIMELVRGVESKFGVQLESRDVIARISYIAKNIESIVPFLVSGNTTKQVTDWVISLI